MLEAAAAWKLSKVTGFDLVDVTLSALQEADNVEFVRGNLYVDFFFLFYFN